MHDFWEYVDKKIFIHHYVYSQSTKKPFKYVHFEPFRQKLHDLTDTMDSKSKASYPKMMGQGIKVALSQKVEMDFPNCPKWVPKKLSWDLENENADSFLRLQV